MLLSVMSKMQPNEFTVPVEGDLMMNSSLFKHFFDICFKEGKKQEVRFGVNTNIPGNKLSFKELFKKCFVENSY